MPSTYPYFGIHTFCGAPHRSLEEFAGGIAVIGVPWDQGVGYRPGARFGPAAIRQVSSRYPIADGYYDIECDRAFLQDAAVFDLGDVDVVATQVERTFENVTATVRGVVEGGGRPLVLGGDHSITFPVVRALDSAPLGILQLDAHLDYADEVGEARHTSSTVMRRVRELPHVQRLVTVGVRGLRTSARVLADSRGHGNVVLSASAFDPRRVLDQLDFDLAWYVTVDLDVLDPGQAPGVSSPEPGGPTVAQVTALVQALGADASVVGCDVVELNPLVDPTGITAVAAANLAVRC
ncbi:MAG: agmatinase, partial [Armatimonadota bacterium]|nr:agmatinase [Armatimonadota bacterium]